MIKRVLNLCVQRHCFINVHFGTEYLNPYVYLKKYVILNKIAI